MSKPERPQQLEWLQEAFSPAGEEEFDLSDEEILEEIFEGVESFGKELDEITEKIDKDEDRLRDAFQSIGPGSLQIGVRQLKDFFQGRKRSRLLQRRAGSFARHLREEQEEENEFIGDHSLLRNMIFFGTDLVELDVRERQKNLLQKEPDLAFFAETILLQQFRDAGEILLRIGGVTLRDLYKGKKLPPHKAFHFLVTARFLNSAMEEAVAGENNSFPFSTYPETTSMLFSSLEFRLLELQTLSEEEVRKLKALSGKGKSTTEATNAVLTLQKNIQKHHQRIFEVLMNPVDTEEFAEIKDEMSTYLNNNHAAISVLFCAGITTPQKAKEAYRRAKQLVQTGSYPQFYAKIAEAVYHKWLRIGFMDDLESLFEASAAGSLPQVDSQMWDALKQSAQSVFQYSSKRIYEVDPQGISWDGFPTPQGVEVVFDQSRPSIFDITLLWNNSETGEATRFALSFDTKNKKFDWPLLDAPFDPELPREQAALRDAGFRLADDLLNDVKLQAEEIKRQKQESRQHAEKARVERQIKTITEFLVEPNYIRDSIYELRKEIRAKARQMQSADIAQEAPSKTTEIERKNKIIIPEDKDALSALLKTIPENVRFQVEASIERYNASGVGNFSKLTLPGPDGEPRFRLALRTQAGGVRVILTKLESSEANGDLFAIERVGMRRDVYKKK